jgi:hypothetical protein
MKQFYRDGCNILKERERVTKGVKERKTGGCLRRESSDRLFTFKISK